MSLAFEYRVADQSHPVRFAMADYELIEQGIRPVLADEMSTLLDTTDFGEEVEVLIDEVINAIDRIVQWVKENPEKVPYTYQFKAVGYEINGMKLADTFSSGGMGFGKICDDDRYSYAIFTGTNQCELTKFDIEKYESATRKQDHIETIDIRDQKQIDIGNGITIHIRKRKARSKLVAELLRLREFLDSQDAQKATKIIG